MPRRVIQATQAELAVAGARKREADRLRQRRRRERLRKARELAGDAYQPPPKRKPARVPRRRAAEAYNREYTEMLLRRAATIREHVVPGGRVSLTKPPAVPEEIM